MGFLRATNIPVCITNFLLFLKINSLQFLIFLCKLMKFSLPNILQLNTHARLI